MSAKPKFDGVIEAAHYTPAGKLEWVRVYERRGPAFGDHVILSRDALIARLQAGKRFVTGKRIPRQGTSFEVHAPVHLVSGDGQAYIVAGQTQTTGLDALHDVPRL
ncbi:MAG: hypothetical protein Fur0018_23740 [Anaerolineales bacterium]